ncbi:PTS system glucose-specific IIA component [Anaerosolibacter carboniphilus]|uniref:PTS system glucose-specific IIA component n=1 Tax=Anaerosolibacter carboniphilus TaxID=1417629 RepID=A0A841KLV6_9FIRM|nr:PTS glucose transporter subunit IIA [Anaerosolibacter carboniphilus]MBB6214383.1 PTS system glucose-specific IIA component [Anaerosolibacter carboniphilus]
MFGFLKKNKIVTLIAPMDGEVISLQEVPDAVFSQRMLGDGIAIKPSNGLVVSPCNGKVVQIFDTNHAVGIETDEGAEVLIHIGIDTVELKGEGFQRIAKVGDKVKIGDVLVEVDLEYIEAAGKSTITPIVITNMEKVHEMSKIKGSCKRGENEIMKLEVKL